MVGQMATTPNKRLLAWEIRKDVPLSNIEIKKAIKALFDDMWDSLPAARKQTFLKKYEKEIPTLVEVLK